MLSGRNRGQMSGERLRPEIFKAGEHHLLAVPAEGALPPAGVCTDASSCAPLLLLDHPMKLAPLFSVLG